MKRLFDTGADLFDYMIIDLPPLLSMVDGRAIEPLVTQFLYIVGWCTISRHVVRDALFQNTAIYKKCLGVILTRSNRSLSHGTLLATRMVTNTTCTVESRSALLARRCRHS